MVMPHVEPTVEVYRGDTTVFVDVSFSEGPTGAETPVDFSEWTLTAHWRETISSTEFLELEVTTPSLGQIVVVASSTQTNMMAKKGVWDVEGIKVGTGEVRTFVRGKTALIEDVTRA